MSRILLWLAPAEWRRCYGPEVLDLMAGSDRPVADRANLFWTCLGLRVSSLTKGVHMRRSMVVASAGMLVLGVAWAVAATPRLRDGVVELPGHWWSAPALVLMVAGAAGITWLCWPRRRVA